MPTNNTLILSISSSLIVILLGMIIGKVGYFGDKNINAIIFNQFLFFSVLKGILQYPAKVALQAGKSLSIRKYCSREINSGLWIGSLLIPKRWEGQEQSEEPKPGTPACRCASTPVPGQLC